MVRVYLNRSRYSEPCRDGGRLVMIERTNPAIYEGDAIGAADFLEAMGVDGRSVEVRHPGGIRSCMNKPDLWFDLRAMA